MPLSHKFLLSKITALVYCLCKLHNFCIDQRETTVQENMLDVENNIARKSSRSCIHLDENMLLIQIGTNNTQNAIPCNERHQQDKRIESNADLPCNKILQQVINSGMVQPRPMPLPMMTRRVVTRNT